MADNPNNDFYSLALASLAQQISLASQSNLPSVSQPRGNTFDPSEYAKFLVERDVPKIDSAVKSYLSLVAARSAVASEIDVISVHCREESRALGSTHPKQKVRCIFVSSATAMDANRSSLICARALLAGINSTVLPDSKGAIKDTSKNFNHLEGDQVNLKHQQDAIRIIWNGLVHNASCTAENKKNLKPTKLLGKNSLTVAYPFVEERFRRGVSVAHHAQKTNNEKSSDVEAHESHSTSQAEVMEQNPLHTISEELLPPILPPKDIDVSQWEAYYTEFGSLLIQACDSNNNNKSTHGDNVQSGDTIQDDSALIWSTDGGLKELQCRRERRTKRAEDALAAEGHNGVDPASIAY